MKGIGLKPYGLSVISLPMNPPKRINPTADAVSSCIQCGTCCGKGGPALHKEDIHLIKSGKILCKSLVTIREGEPAFNNVKNRLVPTVSDIIKIKSKRNRRACIFLDDEDGTASCAIYDIRPVECKALQCWDTTAIEALYDRNRLTRKDLLFETKEIWDLITDHQKRCGYDRIRQLLDNRKDRDNSKIEEVRFWVRYDAHLRSLLSEKGGMDPDIMDFLFGQPLAVTVRRLGIVLDREIL